jgi:hypothetical protein
MTARRFAGVTRTIPGRLSWPVRMPDDLLTEVDRLAAERGIDRAIVLGDLVASVLPDALAEAAREVLFDAETPPAGGLGGAHIDDSPFAAARIPRPRVDAVTGDAG